MVSLHWYYLCLCTWLASYYVLRCWWLPSRREKAVSAYLQCVNTFSVLHKLFFSYVTSIRMNPFRTFFPPFSAKNRMKDHLHREKKPLPLFWSWKCRCQNQKSRARTKAKAVSKSKQNVLHKAFRHRARKRTIWPPSGFSRKTDIFIRTSMQTQEVIIGNGPWLGKCLELVKPLAGDVELQKAGLHHVE